jgi:phospho-N-acetylmuramoyl-pentapeptide-transferase
MLLAGVVALLLVLALGPRSIRLLSRVAHDPNQSDSAHLRDLHRHKRATPTMGGLLILPAIGLSLVVVGDWHTPIPWLALWIVFGLGGLGLVDDRVKSTSAGGRGLSARAKIWGQIAVTLVPALILSAQRSAESGATQFAILESSGLTASAVWLVPWFVLVMVGSSNAVNLTDGLDGLAGGCLICCFAAMGAIAAVMSVAPGTTLLDGVVPSEVFTFTGNRADAAQVSLVAMAACGALAGFLRFNRHPARVFMGDTGSLALGGLLGLAALLIGHELWLPVIGGVFVAETLSVMLQVGFFKWRQVRLLRCAPLHHHFQFKGLPEPLIVRRFWAVAAVCAMTGVALVFATRDQSLSEPMANMAGTVTPASGATVQPTAFPTIGAMAIHVATPGGWFDEVEEEFFRTSTVAGLLLAPSERESDAPCLSDPARPTDGWHVSTGQTDQTSRWEGVFPALP